MSEFNEIVQEIGSWARDNFPGETPEAVLAHLKKEVAEVSESLMEYVAPWSELDGPFSPEAAARVGMLRRFDLLDEIGDVIIMGIRLALIMDANPKEVLENKWGIVRNRVYVDSSRYLQPELTTDDDRPMIDRSSVDWIVECEREYGRFFIAKDAELFHFTRSRRHALGFASEDDARLFIAGSQVIDNEGAARPVREVPGIDAIQRETRRIEG
jgi:hypothetical protein